MKKLMASQVSGYRRDGFLTAQPALSREEVTHFRSALESFEIDLGGRITEMSPMHGRKLHVRFSWAAELLQGRPS